LSLVFCVFFQSFSLMTSLRLSYPFMLAVRYVNSTMIMRGIWWDENICINDNDLLSAHILISSAV
jgi:hypothetical protein